MGRVQHGSVGLGLVVESTQTEHHQLVVDQEEAARCERAVSQAHQGSWKRWDKKSDGVKTHRLSFIVKATYDVLPSPVNLHLWFREGPASHY